MVVKIRTSDEERVALPASILEQLALEEGELVEIDVDDADRLVLRRPTGTVAALREFHGIWEDAPVDEVFEEIRRGWAEWRAQVPA